MSELISREALQKIFVAECEGECRYCKHMKGDFNGCALFDAVPAVDAEPVVRCKDCAFYIPWGDERKICGRVGAYYGSTKPDDFCSRSVRMDLEEE